VRNVENRTLQFHTKIQNSLTKILYFDKITKINNTSHESRNTKQILFENIIIETFFISRNFDNPKTR